MAGVTDHPSFQLFGYLEVIEKDYCNIFVTKTINGVDKHKDRFCFSSKEV